MLIKWIKSVVIEPGIDSVPGETIELERGKAYYFIGLGAAVSTTLDNRDSDQSTVVSEQAFDSAQAPVVSGQSLDTSTTLSDLSAQAPAKKNKAMKGRK